MLSAIRKVFFNFAVLHQGMTNKSIKACRQRQNQAEKLNPSLFKTNSFSVRESRLASQCIFDHKDLVTCAIQRAIFNTSKESPYKVSVLWREWGCAKLHCSVCGHATLMQNTRRQIWRRPYDRKLIE